MQERNINLDILRIFSIFLVVMCHSIPSSSQYVNYVNSGWYMDIHMSSENFSNVICTFINYFGQMGNSVFMIMSSYFLGMKHKFKTKKIIRIWYNTEFISIFFCCILILFGNTLSFKEILYSIFPITFETYWYISCYIFLYLIHGFLNAIIDSINERIHFRTIIIMVVLYEIVDFAIPASGDFYYKNNLSLFVMYYFAVNYIIRYCKTPRFKMNFAISCGGGVTILIFLQILITNQIGIFIPKFSNQMLHWLSVSNPFIMWWGLIVFYIAKNLPEKTISCEMIIKKISSLTLIIYLIHANPLYSKYIRPLYFEFVSLNFRDFYNDNILVFVLLLAFIQFFCSVIIALMYSHLYNIILYNKEDCIFKFAFDVENLLHKIINKFLN